MKWSENKELLDKIDNLIKEQNNNLALERQKVQNQEKIFKDKKLYNFDKNEDINLFLKNKKIKKTRIIRKQIKKIKLEKRKIVKYQMKKSDINAKMLKSIEKSGLNLIKQVKIEKKYSLKINEITAKIAKSAITINGISDLTIVYAKNKI